MDEGQQHRYAVVWDNVSFHHAAIVQNWFCQQLTFYSDLVIRVHGLLFFPSP